MSEKQIIHLSLDEEGLKELYLNEVQKHLEKIEMDTVLLDSKQLCQILNLSWPTIEKLFLNDPNFPKIRVGKKWVFNRGEVKDYIDRWSIETRQQGGTVKL
jgi:predicted DNA-binding transcriptional regulator AlpA